MCVLHRFRLGLWLAGELPGDLPEPRRVVGAELAALAASAVVNQLGLLVEAFVFEAFGFEVHAGGS